MVPGRDERDGAYIDGTKGYYLDWMEGITIFFTLIQQKADQNILLCLNV